MTEFAHDTVVPYKESELSKKQQVANMFDDIAFRYDFLNRFLSAGIDVRWRKKALKQLIAAKPKLLLDVATGTADMAIMASNMLDPEKITGIDISEGMLEIGRQKIAKLNLQNAIELLKGDSETISFPDNTFDAVTVAFGVRNFENLEKGLSEIKRVLKPTGKLIVLEFSKPTTPVISQLYNVYMEWMAPYICKLFSSNRKAYSYLNKSIQKFPEGKNFITILNNLGYINTKCKPLSLGICSIYCAEK
ncbi:bifunctional demethylmenaquinone methyltransferase/2-methoxy-6-polyprenyl-1,4-benzoquinol methylase UbiE [Ferruginibacter albus]|uniref:bifunctional demethylmenaquinone methyltransferase/2-methoxy-6-polyprenyl-1,4-benzoquinol methylase UbiE n=1 Tax=Ferruginibacter albus TaxID=2875540 RepID=UPI001CC44E21|nr:bifunctional demethylmenaquinone methyltransferase/2-methoxy-6-polyprenyl-1,4-benzoquinol methylase UbiE [Ferruginibacter albus]UAY52497.1 bifunctional demethylmenaquinone methyltransferase/2-methoxy-6-polyprenyl-1,4-benzoquinol methylase UbiE [Ferruginibacter albus]